MPFKTILYQILIGPLETFFEIVFAIAFRYSYNYGFTIIVLSLIINILVLPLYKQADKVQEMERETEKRLSHGVNHIKKAFKGDEKMLMLQTYYRQNNYKPTDVFKGSFSLLLEIPFFIAAYNFLSSLNGLNGASFGLITDLGVPDGLLLINGIKINVLPIIMTAVNLVSCVIFTHGSTLRQKIQLYGMAIFFLAFLYDSPSGLVFYQTLNNVFSLVKTIFYKLKNPKKVLLSLSSILGIAACNMGLLQIWPTQKGNLRILVIEIMLLLPGFCYLLKIKNKNAQKNVANLRNPNVRIFYCGAAFATILIGILIPSALIAESPLEFISTVYYYNPIWYIVNSACLAFGLFFIWFKTFYGLMNDTQKVWFERIFLMFDVGAITNYMFFGRKMGIISPSLIYESGFGFTTAEIRANIIALLAIALAMIIILKFWDTKLNGILLVTIFSIFGMSCINVYKIQTTLNKSNITEEKENSVPTFNLSKTEKNVIVLMLDRGMGAYVPYIMNERPELKEQFSGFTYYSNVISYGAFTNFGTPALFGGYEYTPVEMNKRNTELLKDKQNEALKVMPTIFAKDGFDVTVCDPPYAGYKEIPDLSIYKDCQNIKAYRTDRLVPEKKNIDMQKAKIADTLKKFFRFSLMKVSPLSLQYKLYNSGYYNTMKASKYAGQIVYNTNTAKYMDSRFVKDIEILKAFPSITNANQDKGTFLLLQNSAPHWPVLLQKPEYEVNENVNNTDYNNKHKNIYTINGQTLKMETAEQEAHYDANMATMIALGNQFDYLKQIGVYDNTRIILVADHGRGLHQLNRLDSQQHDIFDKEQYFPLLMVKDFNSTEYSESNKFMTNADVPTLAVEGVVQNPINPFTKKKISNDEKTAHPQYILGSYEWNVMTNNGTQYKPGVQLSVHDDIQDKSNQNIEQRELAVSPVSPIETK